MQKFVSKPVEIEAVRITEATFDAPHPNPEHVEGVKYCAETREAVCTTLFGETKAKVGDWLIRGANGEVYPCPHDVFEAKYTPCDVPVIDHPSARGTRCDNCEYPYMKEDEVRVEYRHLDVIKQFCSHDCHLAYEAHAAQMSVGDVLLSEG